MVDLFIALIAAIIILLILQIVTLFRIRRFMGNLRRVIAQLARRKGYQPDQLFPDQLHNCQFCKHRASYIKTNASGSDDDFYYRCKVNNRKISLTHTCKHFQFDVEI